MAPYKCLHGIPAKRLAFSEKHFSKGHYLDSHTLRTLKLWFYLDSADILINGSPSHGRSILLLC